LRMDQTFELILNDIKYKLSCKRSGPNTFKISLLDEPNKYVETNIRVLSDGGFLIALSDKSHVAYVTSKEGAPGLRLNVGGVNILFSADYDPTSLKTDVAGKLVKKLVPDGAHVEKGAPYAEIEVMKMFMPLKVDETGVITWRSNEGAALAAGDLLASLELDTPGRMKSVGVIEHQVEWENARTFFFWRLRRKLAEFDLRKKMQESAEVGRGLKAMTPTEASSMMRDWFLQTPGMTPAMWNDDKAVLAWMAQNNNDLENKVGQLTLDCVSEEVYRVVSAGGTTAKIGTAGVLEGLGRAYKNMGSEDKAQFKKMLENMLA